MKMTVQLHTRRTVLAAAGLTLGLALTGCAGSGNPAGQNGTKRQGRVAHPVNLAWTRRTTAPSAALPA